MPSASLFQNKFSEIVLHYFKPPSHIQDSTIQLEQCCQTPPSDIPKPTFHFILDTVYITKTLTIFQYVRHKGKEFHNEACLKASSAQKNNKKRKSTKKNVILKRA